MKYGKHSYGKINQFGSGGDVIVGNFCSISSNVSVINVGHNTKWISTYPFTSPSMGISSKWNKCPVNIHTIKGHPTQLGDLVIHNDVWIGQGVTFLGGVTIHSGAVVGANSVVAKDVDPYSIVGGNPAKFIKKRFSDDIIKKLLKIQWWNWNDKKIEQNVHLLCSKNINEFVRKYG